MQREFLNTIGMLEQHLLDLRDGGATRLEASPEQVAELGRPAAVAAPSSPSLPARGGAAETETRLAEIAARIAGCEKCRLFKSRTRVVPGQGNVAPEILFVGEGPGADEDQQGLAFVGRAGQLLTKIIEAMGLKREDVFIGNIVKCRPPENRVPAPDEMASCLPYLQEQIALLRPKIIVALGATAMKGLFGENVGGITKIRGRWMQYEGIDVMPTYHPAYLLRNPPAKPDVWEDMKAVLARLGRSPPPARGTAKD
jgi:DNA polymerase